MYYVCIEPDFGKVFTIKIRFVHRACLLNKWIVHGRRFSSLSCVVHFASWGRSECHFLTLHYTFTPIGKDEDVKDLLFIIEPIFTSIQHHSHILLSLYNHTIESHERTIYVLSHSFLYLNKPLCLLRIADTIVKSKTSKTLFSRGYHWSSSFCTRC